MKWVIQNNLYAEEAYETLLETLDRLGLQKTLVKCIPFGGGMEVVEGTLPEDGAHVVVMGSYTLARVAQERRWSPGAWLENLDFQLQRVVWGDRMLNADSVVAPLRNVIGSGIPFFVRPVHETKSFTGQVFDMETWTTFRDGVLALTPEDSPQVTGGTLVQFATRKEIYSETRTWIVKGKVVTASGYKLGTIKRYTSPILVDSCITDFAQSCADIWCPNDAFVLDVADTADGLKIVEINNLNSAGWYRADLQRLVVALEAM